MRNGYATLAVMAGIGFSIVAVAEVRAGDAIKRIWINAPIAVEADGAVKIGQVAGAGTLAEIARTALGRKRYEPARRYGQAISSSTHLTASLVLTPEGPEDYVVSVEGINLAPAGLKVIPPRYPIEMVRRNKAGAVELRLLIGLDGKPKYLSTVSSTDRNFEKAAIDSLEGWKFEPQIIAGESIEIEISLPFRFVAGRMELRRCMNVNGMKSGRVGNSRKGVWI